MNRQEVFNAAVAGLASQKFERSLSKYGSFCRYRAYEGANRCAIGWLISDQYYNDVLEGQTCSQAPVVEALKASLRTASIDTEFLVLLQKCHDSASCAFDMIKRLRSVAEMFNLRIPDEIKLRNIKEYEV